MSNLGKRAAGGSNDSSNKKLKTEKQQAPKKDPKSQGGPGTQGGDKPNKQAAPKKPTQQQKPQQQQQQQQQQQPKKAKAAEKKQPPKAEEEETKEGEEDEGPVVAVNEDQMQALDDVSSQIEAIEERCLREIREIEHKFDKERRPLYRKRATIAKTIPSFWQLVIVGHPTLSSLLDQIDLQILLYMTDLDVQLSDADKPSYSITLSFKPNEFFSNTQLTKKFTSDEEGKESVETSPIKWKDPSFPQEHGESFFVFWFDESTQSQRDEQNDAMGDGIGDMFRDEIHKDAIKWFYLALQQQSEDSGEDDENGGEGGDNDGAGEGGGEGEGEGAGEAGGDE
jgi:chemotaxis protein histidine kinase CheA